MRLGILNQMLAVLTFAIFITSVCPKVVSCWKKWIKMSDDNYLKALERYNNCGKLVDELKGETKLRYKKCLIENLHRSSNYFINHTEMTPVEVIQVLHRANRLAKSWAGNSRTTRMADYPLLNCCPVEPEDDDEDQTSLTALRWYFWWKFLFYSFMALIVLQGGLLFVLFCRVSCSDLFIKFPSCPFQVGCKYEAMRNKPKKIWKIESEGKSLQAHRNNGGIAKNKKLNKLSHDS